MPNDFLLADLFEMFFDQRRPANQGVRAGARELRRIRRQAPTQQLVLDGVVNGDCADEQVAEGQGAGEQVLKKTPAILMALWFCPTARPMTPQALGCPVPTPTPTLPCPTRSMLAATTQLWRSCGRRMVVERRCKQVCEAAAIHQVAPEVEEGPSARLATVLSFGWPRTRREPLNQAVVQHHTAPLHRVIPIEGGTRPTLRSPSVHESLRRSVLPSAGHALQGTVGSRSLGTTSEGLYESFEDKKPPGGRTQRKMRRQLSVEGTTRGSLSLGSSVPRRRCNLPFGSPGVLGRAAQKKARD